MSKWVKIQEVVGYGIYGVFLVFFGVLIFFSIGEEEAYYFIGYPAIILILASLIHSMVTSMINGTIATKNLFQKIEISEKEEIEEEKQALNNNLELDLDNKKVIIDSKETPETGLEKMDSPLRIKKAPIKVTRVSSDARSKKINRVKKKSKFLRTGAVSEKNTESSKKQLEFKFEGKEDDF